MRMILMLAAVLLTACGYGFDPMPGGSCSPPKALKCVGAKQLLVCEGTTWAGYACPSCSNDKCDWKGALNGDGCPRVAETFGTCPLDGRLVGCFFSVSADAGVFIESACPACVAGKSIEELGKCSGGRCSCQ